MTKIIDHGIIFKTIKLMNFLSFGNQWTEVDLNSPGTNHVIGENLDNGGSSGAGKSTLINAISYCLFDKIPANVSKDKLINSTNDRKNTLMEVNLTFSKGEDEYLVRRWRGRETGVQLCHLVKDEWVDITPASVSRGEDSFNAKLEELVGFSYNLFSQIILFNGSSKPFLDLSVGEQRNLIEELFRITVLSRKATALKKQVQEVDKSIAMQKLLVQQQQKQNEVHQKHIVEAQNRASQWDTLHHQELIRLKQKLTDASSIDYDTEESLITETGSIKTSISTLRSEIRELEVLDQAAVKAAQAKKQSDLRELTSKKSFTAQQTSPHKAQQTILTGELTKLKKDLATTEQELEHLRDAKCPYCLQTFVDAKSKITGLETKQTSCQSEIPALTDQLADLKVKNDKFEEAVRAEVKLIDEIINTMNMTQVVIEDTPEMVVNRELTQEKRVKLTELSGQLQEINSVMTFTDISMLLTSKNEITTLQAKVEAMSKEVNPHQDALASLLSEGEVQVDLEALDTLIKVQEHQQFLLKLLTDKNSFIRKNIISKTIPFLNKRIAYYTTKLNLPHVVLFQPDMSCEISQIGRELDHGNLSNGEKKKLNLSLCLAFRDVLTYLHSKVNVLLTDEIDGGTISGPDLDALITMLKSKAWDDNISIFVISHRSEFDGRCDNTLVIRKEGGFSSLILQPDE